MKRIIFTVTNDLTYDQRMHRICHSLAAHGYDVLLVGRKLSKSVPLTQQTFGQKRLTCLEQVRAIDNALDIATGVSYGKKSQLA